MRLAAWLCIALLAYLSLVPDRFQTRTGAPTQLEHFIAYFGTASFLMLGYPRKKALAAVLLMAYGCLLELGQLISPGRFPSVIDATASVFGVASASIILGLFAKWNIEGLRSDSDSPSA